MKQIPERCKEPFRFAAVGAAATGIHYAIYYVLKTILSAEVSFTAGYIGSLACNFYLSSVYTFRRRPTRRRGIGFLLSHAANYLMQIGLLHLFIGCGIDDDWAPLPVYAITIPVNFLLVRRAIKQ